MTDQTNADPKRAGDLAQKLVATLIHEDSATRRRAIDAAMMLLGEAPIASSASHTGASRTTGKSEVVSFAQFFNRDEKLTPAENAQLCAAYRYSQHGADTFSLDEVRSIANNAGLVLPDRLDMTFKSLTKGGKKLFQPAGRAMFKPTAAAGLLFHERWGVKPGTSE